MSDKIMNVFSGGGHVSSGIRRSLLSQKKGYLDIHHPAVNTSKAESNLIKLKQHEPPEMSTHKC